MVTRADFELWQPGDVARLLALVISERDYYQEILSALPAPLLIIGESGQAVWANQAFLRLTGLGVNDVRGKPLGQVLPAGIRTTEIRLNYHASEETVLVAERAEEAAAAPDVYADRIDVLQAAAGRLAHDLNNPLMVVAGYAEELLEALPADHALRSDAGEIQKAAARIAAVAARLSEFARKNANPAQSVDVAKILNVAGGPLIALADSAQLEEAVTALAGADRTAVRCFLEGGRVCVALGKALAKPEAALTAKLDSPEALAGLAAARAYTCVRQWGGDIVFGDAETRIYLARPERAAPAPAQPAAAGPAAVTILVVDDEAGIRTLIRKILAREGYQVLEAASAEEALEAARRQRVDLLVTDVVLPQMAGSELARRLHESDPRLRVLYISGFTPDETVRGAAFPPGAGFLAKPFTLSTLLEKVRQALA